MSLEAAIAKNTAALEQLIVLISAKRLIDNGEPGQELSDAETETATEEAAADQAEAAETPAETIEDPTENDVRTALMALAASKGREVAQGVLEKYKAKKIPDLKESVYPAVLERINNLLAA